MSATASYSSERLVRHLAGRLRDGGHLHAAGCDVCAAYNALPLGERFAIVRQAGELLEPAERRA